MNKIYGVILLLLIPCMTYAQAAPTKLWGEVKNTSGEAMDFASIVVMNPNLPNKILASTYTGDDGKYQITVRCDCDSLMLRVSRIEMKSVVMKRYPTVRENSILRQMQKQLSCEKLQ